VDADGSDIDALGEAHFLLAARAARGFAAGAGERNAPRERGIDERHLGAGIEESLCGLAVDLDGDEQPVPRDA
jgi:hypothetical protein